MIKKTLDIYTDAGGKKESYGFGILFIKPDETEQRFNYKSNLQLIRKEFGESGDNDNNSTILESYAVLKALQNITEKYDKIVIYTDSLGVYEEFNNVRKHLIKNRLFKKIIKKCEELMGNVEIRWIKAHVGVYGNEIADRLAKRASKNKKIPFCNLTNTMKFKAHLYTFNFLNSFNLDQIWIDTSVGKKYETYEI